MCLNDPTYKTKTQENQTSFLVTTQKKTALTKLRWKFCRIANMSLENPKCLVDVYKYDVGCLVLAIAIVVVLSFMKKRVKLRPDLCNGRPAIPVPVDFLGNDNNRFTIALAFGATAASCFKMFIQTTVGNYNPLELPSTRWGKAFQALFLTLCYGIITYPYLACLNTDCRIVGAIIGLTYSFVRVMVDLFLYFGCDYGKDVPDYEKYLDFFVFVPALLCTTFLIGKFAILTYREARYHYRHGRSGQKPHILRFHWKGLDERPLANDTERLHVRLLLLNKINEERTNEKDPWYIKMMNSFYKPRPDFRFSKQFLSSLVVSVIFIYQVTLFFIALVVFTIQDLKKVHPKQEKNLEILKVLCLVSLGISSAISLLQILCLTRSHRNDVMIAYKSRSGLLPNTVIEPKMLVVQSLNFCGYQIAVTGIGMIVMSLAILCPLLAVWGLTTMSKEEAEESFFNLLPVIIITTLTWISSGFMSRIVFHDPTYPDITVTIDNRRLYCVMSYFYFFLNIIVGCWLGLKSRVLKGAALGLVYLPRLDRAMMIKGSNHSMDSGHMAYVGFINVLVSFRHPVMLCFCQLLIDRRNAKLNYTMQSADERPCISTKALNRWFLAVLLMRNPSLARYRVKGCCSLPVPNPRILGKVALLMQDIRCCNVPFFKNIDV